LGRPSATCRKAASAVPRKTLANDGHDQCDPTRKLTAIGKPMATTHSGGISSSSMARA
jgi:hypothetical protein